MGLQMLQSLKKLLFKLHIIDYYMYVEESTLHTVWRGRSRDGTIWFRNVEDAPDTVTLETHDIEKSRQNAQEEAELQEARDKVSEILAAGTINHGSPEDPIIVILGTRIREYPELFELFEHALQSNCERLGVEFREDYIRSKDENMNTAWRAAVKEVEHKMLTEPTMYGLPEDFGKDL